MPGTELEFHVRNLLAAACDSLSPLLAFRRDLLERAPIALEFGLLPDSVCQRCTITSTYFGSSSIPQHTRSVSSAAANVVPLPRKGSYTNSPRLVWFRIGRRIRSTGFWVGWSYFSSSDPPMMNLADGESQMVEFSPAFPNQGAFFLRTYHQRSC